MRLETTIKKIQKGHFLCHSLTANEFKSPLENRTLNLCLCNETKKLEKYRVDRFNLREPVFV